MRRPCHNCRDVAQVARQVGNAPALRSEIPAQRERAPTSGRTLMSSVEGRSACFIGYAQVDAMQSMEQFTSSSGIASFSLP